MHTATLSKETANMPQKLLFPWGLHQTKGVHYSVDALLLAAFVQGNDQHIVDLGAGCGVIGLDLLLRGVAASVYALENDPDQAACARANAAQLGLTAKMRLVEMDITTLIKQKKQTVRTPAFQAAQVLPLSSVSQAAPVSHIAQFSQILPSAQHSHVSHIAQTVHRLSQTDMRAQADVVVCNPPWRLLGRERPPVCAKRRHALFGTEECLPLFVQAGAALLRVGGRFALLVGADRLADALTALKQAELSPSRLCCVHTRPNRPAVFAMLEAQRGVQSRLCIEAPRVLHGPHGRAYTPEIRHFCPWLSA